ncbi:NAD binding domain of 6-phosphogluconate dehydrogenase-domain-containing protein [Aspergillus pseudoustus]|uniref:NAD binding domain of 6-phosphogluconate dehydrogenase-domain-containing protein n=1 Tax=Aspergillus pseudoustus TaxID=1810923 RepID=A0ABR4IWU8_9EURO
MTALEYSRVGFIGLGAMGKPMVEQLAAKLPAHAHVYVHDVVQASIDELVAKFAGKVIACRSAREVAESSEVIITMVPEGAHVRSVYLAEPNGICSIDLQDRILIDCSTIDTATNLAVKQRITDSHGRASFYDAPVSGGTLGAQKGTIAFFLGCADEDPKFAMLSSLLRLMGKQVIACGGASLGLASKLCNNYLSGLIAIASAEALSTGIKAGLDPRVLSRVFAAGTAQNAICDRFNPCPGVVADAPSSSGYRGGFKVQLMKKDFALAVDLAGSVGARLVLGDVGLRTYESAAEDPRCRDLDSRVVFRLLGGDEKWEERLAQQNGQN